MATASGKHYRKLFCISPVSGASRIQEYDKMFKKRQVIKNLPMISVCEKFRYSPDFSVFCGMLLR